jgi:Uma2 family endonuclease
MTVALRRTMTVDEYLTWSTSQSQRSRTELINGQIVTMPAERLLRSRTKGNTFLALRLAIKAARLPCEALTD